MPIRDETRRAALPAPQIRREVDVSVEALRAGMLHIEKELLWFMGMVKSRVTSTLKGQPICWQIRVGNAARVKHEHTGFARTILAVKNRHARSEIDSTR
jgi:hypothetical protein